MILLLRMHKIIDYLVQIGEMAASASIFFPKILHRLEMCVIINLCQQ